MTTLGSDPSTSHTCHPRVQGSHNPSAPTRVTTRVGTVHCTTLSMKINSGETGHCTTNRAHCGLGNEPPPPPIINGIVQRRQCTRAQGRVRRLCDTQWHTRQLRTYTQDARSPEAGTWGKRPTELLTKTAERVPAEAGPVGDN